MRTTFSLPEDSPVGTVVGTVRASDDDANDVLSHELSGTDAGAFKIDIATGVITVAMELDHEAGGAGNDGLYDEVTVTAYDPSNGSGTATLTITATDVNEAPTVGGADTTTAAEISCTRSTRA